MYEGGRGGRGGEAYLLVVEVAQNLQQENNVITVL